MSLYPLCFSIMCFCTLVRAAQSRQTLNMSNIYMFSKREIVSAAVAVNHFCHNTGSSLLKPKLKCLYIYFF